ncbi:MAG: hypothetical protein M5R41_02640 [Bacteroidia bacterium]|nr:hypothetical protein [Bacteroidia bacterium]
MRCFLILIFTFALLFASQFRASAQQSGFDFVRVGNGFITVAVERSSGQFRIEAADGTPLLFQSKNGVTAYTNVRFGSVTYTTNVWNRSTPPAGTVPLPLVSVSALSDRVRLLSTLRKGPDSLGVQIDFIPSLDGDFAYVDVVTQFQNHGRRNAEIGVLHLFDITLSRDDNAQCFADHRVVHRETAWSGAAVPRLVEAASPALPYRVRLRTESAAGAVPPDVLVLGNWQYSGYLGAVAWEYTASGIMLTDAAVLLRWDERPLGVGQQRRIATEYGFLVRTDLELSCSVPVLGITPDSSGYIPQPLPVTAVVRNTGSVPLQNVQLSITSTAPLTLSAGENVVKTIAGPIPPGGDASTRWLFDVAGVDTLSIVPLDISVIAPDTLQRHCALDARIPPIRPTEISISCGDTVRLGLDPGGLGYAPDPFPLRVTISNSGRRTVSGLRATIQLPQEIVLISPSTDQPVEPDPLRAGENTSLLWALRGIVQSMDVYAPCVVRVLAGGEVLAECTVIVQIPGINAEPCIETRSSTAGTDFFLAFLPDNVATGAQSLRVYVTAPQGADVLLRYLGGTHWVGGSIPVGGMDAFELDVDLTNIPAETKVRTGVRLTSDRPVHVYIGNYRERHSDGTAVLPAHALGKEYLTVGYNWESAWEQFLVLATEDATTVTIIPKSITSTDRPDGQPFTVILDQGEVYCVKSRYPGDGGSLSGSRVTADKPVAVFSGGESGWIPSVSTPATGFLNPHVEQMIPVEYLGTQYAAVPFRSRLRGDTYKIVATQPNTQVDAPSGTVTLQNVGDWHEENIEHARLLSADKPVMVAQFANSARWDADTAEYGDGSMLLLTPLDRHISCHYFPAGMLTEDPVLAPNTSLSVGAGGRTEIPMNATTDRRSFTFEAWVQSLSSGSIISQWEAVSPARGWMLHFDQTRSRVILTVADAGQSRDFSSTDNIIFQRQWAHIAVVADADAGTVEVFVNGSVRIQATVALPSPPLQPLTFGGAASGVDWSGYMDECRLWRGVRTPTQILSKRNQRIGVFESDGLIGYWDFCDGWSDASGLGNTLVPISPATLINAWDLPASLLCEEMTDSNFVNIIAPTDATNEVRLNHRALSAGDWLDLPGAPGWKTASVLLPTGLNRLETSDLRGIGASSYGFAYHDAYTAWTGFGAWKTVASFVSSAVPGEPHLHAPWPNPATGTMVYTAVTIPVRQRVVLRIYDAAGRLVRTVVDVECTAGTTAMRIPVGGLAAGTYTLAMQSGQSTLYRTFVRHP